MLINQEHKIKGNTNTLKGSMMMKRQMLGFLTKSNVMSYGEEHILNTNVLSQATKASYNILNYLFSWR